MKKTISLMIALCMILSVFAVNVSAVDSTAAVSVTESRITRSYAILKFSGDVSGKTVKIDGEEVTGTPVSYTADVSADGAVTEANTYRYERNGGYAFDTVYTVNVDGNDIYQFKLNKLFEDDFNVADSSAWTGEKTIDATAGTMTVAAGKEAWYEPSFSGNWTDYVLEADISSTMARDSEGRMIFRKYATSSGDRTNSLSYVVRKFYENNPLTYYINSADKEGSFEAADMQTVNKTTYIKSGIFRTQLKTPAPWASGDSTIYTMYESGGKAYLDLNGTTQLLGTKPSSNTAGGIGIKALSGSKPVVLNKMCAYKVTTNDLINAEPIRIDSVLCTSDKLQLTYSSEPFEAPTVTITDLNNNNAIDARVETVGKTSIITSSQIQSGTLYKLTVSCGKDVFTKYFRKTLRFADDCMGENVAEKWLVRVGGEQTANNSKYIKYDSGKLWANYSTDNVHSDICLSPADLESTICSGTQVFEYTVEWTGPVGTLNNIDYMGFSMSEAPRFDDSSNRNLIAKFDGNGIRMKHTFGNTDNTAAAYWSNKNTTDKLTAANTEYKMIQVVSGNKFDIYKGGKLVLSNTNEKIPTHGRFGFRISCGLKISDIKVVDFELLDEIPSTGFSTTSFAIAPNADKWGVAKDSFKYNAYVNNFGTTDPTDVSVIAAFYDTAGKLVGCDVNKDTTFENKQATVTGSAAVTSFDGVEGKLFVWGNGGLTPLCAAKAAKR